MLEQRCRRTGISPRDEGAILSPWLFSPRRLGHTSRRIVRTIRNSRNKQPSVAGNEQTPTRGVLIGEQTNRQYAACAGLNGNAGSIYGTGGEPFSKQLGMWALARFTRLSHPGCYSERSSNMGSVEVLAPKAWITPELRSMQVPLLPIAEAGSGQAFLSR